MWDLNAQKEETRSKNFEHPAVIKKTGLPTTTKTRVFVIAVFKCCFYSLVPVLSGFSEHSFLTFHKTLEHLQSIICQVVQDNKHCQRSGFALTYTMQLVHEKKKCQCPVLQNDHTSIPIINIHQLSL